MVMGFALIGAVVMGIFVFLGVKSAQKFLTKRVEDELKSKGDEW